MESIQNYIDGELIDAADRGWLDDVEPATGEVYARIPDSGEPDVERACQAARKAWPGWKGTPVDERARLLAAVAERIAALNDELADAESRDNGKPVTVARSVDIPRAAHNFRFFAHAITQWASEAHSMGAIALNYTLRDPLGGTRSSA